MAGPAANYVPLYVMLPPEVLSMDMVRLKDQLIRLREAGVDGVKVHVWWGIVESSRQNYNWDGYWQLFEIVEQTNLKLKAIMAFHQGGTSTPLPQWVLDIGNQNPDIFYTDREGNRKREYLTLGVDHQSLFGGRTAVQVYKDFMQSFRDTMSNFLQNELIKEIEVGLGPAGELRYPSYPQDQARDFYGIGEFQCYDNYIRADRPVPCPRDTGNYYSTPDSTGFFRSGGGYTTDQGKSFLTWYSYKLLKHGDDILGEANKVFRDRKVKLAAKVSGMYWWYKTDSHAAELTAGYYNLNDRDGYRHIAKILNRHHGILICPCLGMRDTEYPNNKCGPEELVQQVLTDSWIEIGEGAGENTIPRFDQDAYSQILSYAKPRWINPPWMYSVTYRLLSDDLFIERNFSLFRKFVKKLHGDQEPQTHEIPPLPPSDPPPPSDEELKKVIKRLPSFAFPGERSLN